MRKLFYQLIVAALVCWGALPAFAQGGFGFSYNMSLPLADTHDFADKFSFRGFGLQGRGEIGVSDFYLGGSVAWNVYVDEEFGTFETNEIRTSTGKAFRYINAVPIYFKGYRHEYINDHTEVFLGLGVGTIYQEQRTEFGVFAFTEDAWHFGLSPEIGVVFIASEKADIFISVEYNVGFEASGVDQFSNLSFNIGFLY